MSNLRHIPCYANNGIGTLWNTLTRRFSASTCTGTTIYDLLNAPYSRVLKTGQISTLDRFPSDKWVCPTFAYAPLAGCITVGFGLGFVVGWNYRIPTHAESLLWRMCSVHHAVFSIFRELYYGFGMMKCNKPCSQSTQFPEQEPSSEEGRRRHTRYLRDTPNLRSLLRKWDNTLPDQDPILRNPLCVLVPVTIICAIYILCRLYLYAEGFASL